MATVPAGALSLALQTLREMLADSATYRTWTGTASQVTALATIYRTALPPPASNKASYTLAELVALRPFTIVWSDSYLSSHDATSSDGFDHQEGGMFRVRFEWDVPSGVSNDPAEIELQIENTIGKIIDELWDMAGIAPYLTIRDINWEGEVERSHENDQTLKGDFVTTEMVVSWGQQ